MQSKYPDLTSSGPDHQLQELGRRLAELRLERNQPQAQLAEEAGVSLATVRRLEAGQSVQLANWLRVLRALGLSERLKLLLPPPAANPLLALELERQRSKRRRQRASTPRQPEAEGTWTWGEDR